jgi:hypothetical protein
MANVSWRSTNTTAGNATTFCSAGGGTWPAVQALVTFLVTNIIGHAATIRIPPGTGTAKSARRMIAAVFNPVFAGSFAFRSLGRWLQRFRFERKSTMTLKNDKLEHAVTAGAVAICIPLKFAPLLVGKWELADNQRQIVMWGHQTWCSTRDHPERPKEGQPKLPFRPSATFPRYLPFILPPDVQFSSKYRKSRISPSSNVLSSVIAIVQVGLSIRQLVLNYGPSIVNNGLSSPYLIVIPYILMSLVNLIVNFMVGSYRRITMMPMKDAKLPKYNEVYIVNCLQRECPGELDCPERSQHLPRVLAIKSSASDTNDDTLFEGIPCVTLG